MSLDCFDYYLWSTGRLDVDNEINEELLTTLMEVDYENEIL